jgi:hypothetical protein
VKKYVNIFVIGCALVLISGILSAGEKPWFDMENCVFCKNLAAEPGLLDNMKWEHYDIEHGALAMTVVAPKYEEAFTKAQKEMQDVAMKMAKGETEGVVTCGHCDTYAMLMMSGAKFENVKTSAGYITLITSDDEEMIKKIHAFAQRNRDEMAKMAAEKMEN